MGEQLATTTVEQDGGATSARPGGLEIALGVGLLICLLLLLTRWWDATGRVPIVQSLVPFWGLGVVGLTLLAAALRRWRVVIAGLLASLLPLGLAVPTFGSDTVPARPGDEVILALNLEYGQADPSSVVEQVRRRGVAALVLLEVTPEALTALDRAGLKALLPQQVGSAWHGAGGSVIRSRHRLYVIRTEHVPGQFDQPVARVLAPDLRYLLRAVHPYPPVGHLADGWRRQMARLHAWVEQQPRDLPVVLAGDLNSSHAHPAFRVLARGMTDAHRAVGSGWVRTWPQGSVAPAFVQLDHVLVRGGGVVDAGTEQISATDHSAVWARLRLNR